MSFDWKTRKSDKVGTKKTKAKKKTNTSHLRAAGDTFRETNRELTFAWIRGCRRRSRSTVRRRLHCTNSGNSYHQWANKTIANFHPVISPAASSSGSQSGRARKTPEIELGTAKTQLTDRSKRRIVGWFSQQNTDQLKTTKPKLKKKETPKTESENLVSVRDRGWGIPPKPPEKRAGGKPRDKETLERRRKEKKTKEKKGNFLGRVLSYSETKWQEVCPLSSPTSTRHFLSLFSLSFSLSSCYSTQVDYNSPP